MIGFVRTRIAAVHSPSPAMAGCTGGEISSGRFGIVVVLVEVVVETSITPTVVVVDVVAVVGGVESVDGTDGQDCVATVGTRCAGTALSTIVVVVVSGGVDVDTSVALRTAMVVVVATGSVSNVTRASESAGATAGASLWVQVSI